MLSENLTRVQFGCNVKSKKNTQSRVQASMCKLYILSSAFSCCANHVHKGMMIEPRQTRFYIPKGWEGRDSGLTGSHHGWNLTTSQAIGQSLISKIPNSVLSTHKATQRTRNRLSTFHLILILWTCVNVNFNRNTTFSK